MRITDAPVMMEDHDKALAAWQKAGVQRAVLVHVDAHIDFGWIPETDFDEIDPAAAAYSRAMINPLITSRRKMLTIGNYIYPAVKQGIVRKFYWVVPQRSMYSRRGRRFILRQLKRLLRCAVDRRLRAEKDVICCHLDGCELIVCTLGSLERLAEPVLLDIDVDFLMSERIWDDLDPQRLPWIMPEELWRELSAKLDEVRLLTVAYSVEGGYTPLRFKYLGDELAALSRGGLPRTAALKREALSHERAGRWQRAYEAYFSAGTLFADDASIAYTLCDLHLEHGCATNEEAAAALERCLCLDRSYATTYNNRGILYFQQGRFRRAERAFHDFLRVDAENPAVFSSLGHICLEQKRFSEAQQWFDRCLALDNAHPGALLGKALWAMRTGVFSDAESMFEALSGLLPEDPQSRYWLGRLAQRRGALTAAAGHYRQAVLRGWSGPGVHLRLAWICLRRKMFFRAAEELRRSWEEMRVCR